MIREIVRSKRMYKAVFKFQKILKDIKKQIILEPDDLFDDKNTFDNKHDISANEEISLLALKDHLNSDITYILD